jgi:predicted Zn-dependent protease
MRACLFLTLLAVLAVPSLGATEAFTSGTKRSKSDRDILAIGHRNLANNKKGLGNWHPPDREIEMGKQLSTQLELSLKLLDDRDITAYVAKVGDNIAKNSDLQMPVTFRLIDSDQVEAFTLPGGYQYLSRGLLLELQSESELASVLARGIAHTALRSATRLMTRQQWANIGTIPLIVIGLSRAPSANLARNSSLSNTPLIMLGFKRQFEFDADYFGIQYLYKAGYNTDSFTDVVQRVWPSTKAPAEAFSPFPPTSDRVKLLREEIVDLLPRRAGALVSTPEFERFRQLLLARKLMPAQNEGLPLPRE